MKQHHSSSNLMISSLGKLTQNPGESNTSTSQLLQSLSSFSRESRLISERLGDDRWRRTMSVSQDGGRTWSVLWIDELHRAKES